MTEPVKNCVAQCRDTETKVRLVEDKFKSLRDELDELAAYKLENDKYLGLFHPVKAMNQVSDALHAVLEGPAFNRFLAYEKKRYQHLESLILDDDMTLFDKKTYKIPILPEPVDESKYLASLEHAKMRLRQSTSSSENTMSEGRAGGFQKFKYAKTYIPDNIDKLTEKLPSPTEN